VVRWVSLPSPMDLMSIFKTADFSHLEFYGSNNGFCEKPIGLSIGHQNIETIALNCLVFEKISLLCIGILATDRQTDGQAQRIKPP